MVNEFQDKKVLVTGGVGFIGSNLVRSLVKLGAKVTVIDSMEPLFGGNLFNLIDIQSKVDLHIDDIRNREKMRELLKGQDILFHLAAQTSHVGSMQDPIIDLEINVMAQLDILEICREINREIKIVFTSTRQIYGKPDVLPVSEQHPLRPPDVNGINKLAAEQYLQLYHQQYGIRSCILRLTNTYGPCMRVKDARQTFLGIWIRRLLENGIIQVFGDGKQLRDFNYIDDCISALLLAAAKTESEGKIFNLGSEEVVSLEQMARILTSLGYGGAFEVVPFPEGRESIDIGSYYSNFSFIHESLDWKPEITLRNGLRKTIEYFDVNRAHYWT